MATTAPGLVNISPNNAGSVVGIIWYSINPNEFVIGTVTGTDTMVPRWTWIFQIHQILLVPPRPPLLVARLLFGVHPPVPQHHKKHRRRLFPVPRKHGKRSSPVPRHKSSTKASNKQAPLRHCTAPAVPPGTDHRGTDPSGTMHGTKRASHSVPAPSDTPKQNHYQ